MSSVLNTGDMAPDFEAETYGGETVKLSDVYKEGTVALYFYPKDNTPGCTKEACSLRDGMDDLEGLGINVLGVSTDGVKAHENFKNKYNLNFPLISDKSKDIIKLYGVKSAFGTAKRETFLINSNGEIVHIWTKVNTKKHAEEIVDKVRELGI